MRDREIRERVDELPEPTTPEGRHLAAAKKRNEECWTLIIALQMKAVAARERIEALERDKARLNWLEQVVADNQAHYYVELRFEGEDGFRIEAHDKNGCDVLNGKYAHHDTLREAIDAALAPAAQPSDSLHTDYTPKTEVAENKEGSAQ